MSGTALSGPPPAEDAAAWLIHELFRRRAAESPTHTAIAFQGHEDDVESGRACPGLVTMTYGELDAASDRLAAKLRRCGICRDKLVAVRMDRSPGMIVAFMAILKAGGAYVPIDPTHPKDRQEYVIGVIRALVVLVDEANSASSKEMELPPGCTVITLRPQDGAVVGPQADKEHTALQIGGEGTDSSSSGRAASTPTQNRPHQPSVSDEDPTLALAYVLFTSGSTGKPKGVCVQHRGVVNLLQWFARDVGIGRSDRVLALTTNTFDISVLELFMPLVTGCTVHLLSSGFQKDARGLSEVLTTQNISLFQATPATFEMLMAVNWLGDKRIHVLCGGEAFRLNLAPITTRCRSFRNVYGPTETTIWSTCYKVEKEPDKPLPLGEPISETDLYVLKALEGQGLIQCKPGEEGELYIGGVGLARGYFELPEMTASKFIPNPFGSGRIYATGDIVVREADGSLKYVGRSDSQVKIQGYRVELGEIEKTLQVHPDMQTAVVVARDGPAGTGGKMLVAYLRPKGYDNESCSVPPSLEEDKVKAYLGQHLPPYMVPRHYVYLHDFQYTANGKIDRKLLPPPPMNISAVRAGGNGNGGVTSTPILSHRDSKGARRRIKPMTAMVMDVITRASGIDVRPSFELQALRIDSLGTVLIVEQLSRAMGGLRIRPVEFFEQDTIEGLANHLHRRIKSEKPELLDQLGLSRLKRGDSGALFDGVEGKGEDPDDHDDSDSDDDNGKDKPFDIASSSIPLERTISGLRGMLIIWVVLEHYTARPMLKRLAHRYTVNTGFFAILSGVSLYAWYAASKQHRWGSYFFNKVVGVFPVYYLAIVLTLPQYYALHRRVQELHPVPPGYKLLQEFDYGGDVGKYLLDALLYLTAMQNYYPRVMKRAMYSLYYASIQWNLYLYFPIVATLFALLTRYGLSQQQRNWMTANKLGLWVACLLLSLFIPSVMHAFRYTGTLMYSPQLLTGIALMGIFIEMEGERKRHRETSPWRNVAWEVAPWVLLLGFSVIAFNPAIPGYNTLEDRTLPYTVLPVIGTLFILVLMLDKSWLRSTLVELDVLRMLGDLSYNIYLLNQIVGTYYLRMAVEAWPSIVPPAEVSLKALIPLPFYVFQWIQDQSPLLKIFALILVISFSWMVQTFFVEQAVVPAVVWLMSALSRPRRPRSSETEPSAPSKDRSWRDLLSGDKKGEAEEQQGIGLARIV